MTTRSAEPDAMRRFARWFLIVAIAVTAAVGVFNAVIDPYGVTGLNRVGIYEVAEREYKSRAVKKSPHNGLIISHSRLSAQDPRLLEGYEFFNFAVGGARLEEIRDMLARNLNDQEVVILGLDFWMFNGKYWQFDPTGSKPITWTRKLKRYLLSFDYFLKSIEAMQAARAGEPKVLLDPGYLNESFWVKRGETDPALKQTAIDTMSVDYQYAPERMQILREIKQTLEAAGVRLQVFLHPESPVMRERLHSPELEEQYAAWKSEILELFPDTVDLSHSVEFAREENFYLYDPVHYKPGVSTRFLNELVIPSAQAKQDG